MEVSISQCNLRNEEGYTMFVIQGSLDIVDGGIWHTASFEYVKPLLGCFCLELVFYNSIESIAVLDS